jgi:hypothetical protein
MNARRNLLRARLRDRGDERCDGEPKGDPLDEPIPSPIAAHLPAPFLLTSAADAHKTVEPLLFFPTKRLRLSSGMSEGMASYHASSKSEREFSALFLLATQAGGSLHLHQSKGKHDEGSGDALLPQKRGKQYADSYTVT